MSFVPEGGIVLILLEGEFVGYLTVKSFSEGLPYLLVNGHRQAYPFQ